MTGRLSRGWSYFKQSFSILRQDKGLAAFPVVSAILSLVVLGLFFFPVFLVFSQEGIDPDTMTMTGWILWILLLFVFYLIIAFISSFFKAGVVANATRVLQGEHPRFGEGIGAAAAKVGALFSWAVVTATVGVILSLIRNQDSPAGRIIGSLIAATVGAVWSLATFFVIPVILFEDAGGVFSSIGESWGLFKKTWGETTVAGFSFGLLYLPVLFVSICCFLVLLSGNWTASVGLFVVLIILLVLTGVFASALHGILVAILYQYATTGTVPPQADANLVKQAFVEGKGKKADEPFRPGTI